LLASRQPRYIKLANCAYLNEVLSFLCIYIFRLVFSSFHHLSHTTEMPSLLDLPRELVQQIILYTLQPPFNRPTSPECIKLGDRVTSGKRRGKKKQFQDPIMYYYRKNPIHSLTLTCRQLHMDTADVWKREGDKLDCKIDVMITEDDDFLVTWLMYPKRMVDMPNGGWKVEKVDIGLRFFQGQLERSAYQHHEIHTLY
jgi:hypothetical protein